MAQSSTGEVTWGKVLRNSAFTLLIIFLSGFGVHWNRQVMSQRNPVVVGQSVLASIAQPTSSSVHNLALQASYSKGNLRLGETQQLIITSEPFAQLDIVTIYPDGTINNDQTFKAAANEVGQYTMRFKLTDFHDLGVFKTFVVARLGERSNQVDVTFSLQTWAAENPAAQDTLYQFPIIP